jgi:hypothetical protein
LPAFRVISPGSIGVVEAFTAARAVDVMSLDDDRIQVLSAVAVKMMASPTPIVPLIRPSR